MPNTRQKVLYNPEGWVGRGVGGVGGRFRMGKRVHPWVIHVNVCQKPPQEYTEIACFSWIFEDIYLLLKCEKQKNALFLRRKMPL